VSVREELLSFLRDAEVDLPADAPENTSLLRSGRVDSVTLFRLASWIEQAMGARIDPASFDLSTEWETIGDVVRFVERARRGT
jgi:acyl carrier protein